LEKKDQERIAIETSIKPFEEQKYGLVTSLLGPPTSERVAPVPGDIASVQAVLQGGLLMPSVGPHHLFLGLQDTEPFFDTGGGRLLQTIRMIQTAPGYLGAWPKRGLLDLLPLGLVGQPDALGYTSLPFGLWRRQQEGYSVLSFHRSVLNEVTPNLRLEEAENPAQIRINVGDLSASKVAPWINAVNYDRALRASVGNSRFLHLLSQQMQLPRDQALLQAQRLLGVQLICPVGGKYQLVEHQRGLKHWTSTDWPETGLPSFGPAPDSYRAPLLAWFRGLEADLIMEGDYVHVRAQLDMQRQASAPGIKLPLFNLFGKPKPKDQKPAEEPEPELEELPPPEPLPPPRPSPE
jgi:hypothetical protein